MTKAQLVEQVSPDSLKNKLRKLRTEFVAIQRSLTATGNDEQTTPAKPGYYADMLVAFADLHGLGDIEFGMDRAASASLSEDNQGLDTRAIGESVSMSSMRDAKRKDEIDMEIQRQRQVRGKKQQPDLAKRQIRARVVAKDVAAFLLETGHLSYDPYIKTERETALRSVQKYVKYCGYLRGSKRGKKSLALTEANTILRDNYVRFMCQATQQVHTTDRRTVVYLDEGFINQHYNINDISLYDDLDVQVKAIHKGRRFRFIAAIVDGGPFESFVVCYEKFFGGKQTKDYHGMVDHKYFVARFGRLLVDLADRGISNTIIVMDNAKYHKCIPDATPRFSWRKADLMVACDALGIEHTPGELKASIWSKLQPYTASVVPVVVEMASAAGHEVVTTLHDVEMRLDLAFDAVTSAMVHGCIKKSEQGLLELHRHISTIDEDDYHVVCLR
ncbi:hypothetical protein H257_14914 [Aphanomyces astaci]|uniref:Tc1-like transposase DDE domain-containing protein n=1 Tax=Aphanomyces astaci TaxID=112090 RepID=W4FP62_APHAT|nr:hypothetical protein H257_14914 [Aphanomyces astaci]ETV69287.1 hypothetical protein H257_14914 [Aphanomyces astaci]|eukprot:XP_009841144.1 hypothetical protein H257_14914 [Aphanomyces astaci]